MKYCAACKTPRTCKSFKTCVIEGPSPKTTSRARPETPAVDRLLSSGLRPCEVVKKTGLSKSFVQHRHIALCADEPIALSTDTSCPRFAEHDAFCRAVKRVAPGGMPILVLDGPARGAWITADRKPWKTRPAAWQGTMGFGGANP